MVRRQRAPRGHPHWLAFEKARPDVARALIVKWETDPLPNNGLVAREDVPTELVRTIGDLLFGLHTHLEGRGILEPMELSRFEPANEATYLEVVKFLDRFEKEIRPIRGE